MALFIASASVKPYFWTARQTSLHLWAREEVAAAILLHQSLAQCWLSSWLEAGRVGYNTDKLMFLLFSSFPSLFKLCFPPPHHTGLGPTASTTPHKAEEGPWEVWRQRWYFSAQRCLLQTSPHVCFSTGRLPPANDVVSACNPAPEKTTQAVWLQEDHRIYIKKAY